MNILKISDIPGIEFHKKGVFQSECKFSMDCIIVKMKYIYHPKNLRNFMPSILDF